MSVFSWTDAEWSRLLSFITAISTVAVAVLVAWLTSRRENRLRELNRHFQFRDDRSKLYADFVLEMNKSLATLFKSKRSTASLEDVLSELATEGHILDSQAIGIKLQCPNFVSSAVQRVNGWVQFSLASQRYVAGVEASSAELESAKEQMITEMRRDLTIIDSTKNRKEYTAAIRRIDS